MENILELILLPNMQKIETKNGTWRYIFCLFCAILLEFCEVHNSRNFDYLYEALDIKTKPRNLLIYILLPRKSSQTI